MNTQLIVVLLSYIGIPIEAACIIAFIVYIIGGLLLFGALISIINIGTYTKRANEQNEQIIAQNNILIDEIRQIKQQQYSSAENEFKYMQFMTHKQQQ